MPEALQLDLSDLPKQQAAPLTLDLSDLPKQQSAPLQLDLSDLPKAGAARYVDETIAQKAKPEDSWFWQSLESSDTLKPYAQKVREYVESPTDTKGAWDWLTSTVPKSAAQLGVGLARTPFDLAQTFSGESRAAIEKFLQEHPEYEQIVREDPTGESLQALAGIGAVEGTLKTAEMAAKGAAENFKDAW
jgi:hypothetical protein